MGWHQAGQSLLKRTIIEPVQYFGRYYGRLVRVIGYGGLIILAVFLSQTLRSQQPLLLAQPNTPFDEANPLDAQPAVGADVISCSLDPVKLFGTSGDQLHPKAAYNPNNKNYLIVWEDHRQSQSDVYGRLSDEGCPQSSSLSIQFPLDGSTIRHQTLPDVVYNPDRNEYLVIWHEDGIRVGGSLLAADSSFAFTVPRKSLLSDATSDAVYTNTVVTYDRVNKNYLVVTRKDTDNRSILLSVRLTPDTLNHIGEVEQVDTAFAYEAGSMAFQAAGPSNLLIWSKKDSVIGTTGYDLEINLLGPTGLPIIQPINFSSSFDQKAPVVAWHPQCDRYLMVWEDAKNGNKNDLYGLVFTSPTSVLERPIQMTSDRIEAAPAVTAREMENNPGSPEYLAVWQGQNDGEDFSQIYAQRLNCNGQSLPNQSLLKLSTDNLDQRSPAAIYLAREERYLVVWSGWTADDGYDIYAHSVETGLDIVPPVLNETFPLAEAVEVHPDTALTIWFNEPILTGSFGLHTDPPLTFIQPYQWTPDNQTVIVTPTTWLAWEQQYVITVTGQDLSNNSVLLTTDPILGPNPWSFTTRSKPYSYLPSVYRTFCWPFGLLKNGKFDCGRDASSELFGWTVTEENGQNVDLLCQDDGYGYNSLNLNQNPSCVVRLGDPTYGYGPTGGSPSIPNGAATISQAVSLPASGTPSLRFNAYYCSYDQAEFQGKPRDSLEIYVQGQKLAQIGYNTALIQQPASPRCKLESPTISLAQYAGQTVTITFMLWNREHIQPQPDLGYLSTWAYLDNIDVQ